MRIAAFTSAIPMRVIGLIFIVVLSTATVVADVRIKKDNQYIPLIITITGTISEDDAKQIENASSELNNQNFIVDLDSRGGSLSAAIKIGRLIRKYDGATSITGKCYSSCPLIFIGGVKRFMGGATSLGLHRPYFASDPQRRENIEKQFPDMLSMVKSYVAEMGITDNFYQQMVNTEPSKVAIYQFEDFTKLIPQIDPTYAEIQVAYDARKYGVTTSEMRRRYADAESCDPGWGTVVFIPDLDMIKLPNNSEWANCKEARRWGLSQRVYIDRAAKLKQCELNADEKSNFIETPRKLKRDSPLLIRFETCVRNIMLSR